MELRIRLPEDDTGRGLRELHTWLATERELRGCLSLGSEEKPGDHLSGVWDFLVVAAGSGGVGATAVRLFSEWLRLRNPERSWELTVEADGTKTFRATNTSPDELVELARAIEDAPDERA